MRKSGSLWFLGVLGIALAVSIGGVDEPVASEAVRPLDPSLRREALLSLPPAPALSPDKIDLGQRLFFDVRLSHDNSISCAFCHDLSRGGVDRLRVSSGVGGASGIINAPTVFNSGLNFVQFWDGRAATLEEQAAGPVHNPAEMASNWEEVIAKLNQDEDYRKLFQRLYPQQGLSGAAIADAIATFERSLMTPSSRFDRYLNGESDALSELEKAGLRLFLDYGCASCHQGVHLGGNMFQRFGVMDDYFKDRQTTKADLGRYNVTQREEDRHVFKVPSLRNVSATPPYFHDGSAGTLEDAVVIMGRYQLGRELSGEDVRTIAAFLRTLSGEWNGEPIR